ncbi:MAG: putative ligase-like protein [Gemmatimonadetes bacterium]|nr:putative ligase-like protein [Gemmatimonadota bacterium]
MTPMRRKSVSDRVGADVESQLKAIEDADDDGDVDFGRGKKLHVSSLSKVYFPKTGDTKGALMRYYTRIWPVLQPHVDGRPLVLKRFPDGVGGQIFFQQNAGPHVPEAVRVETLNTVEEGPKPRIIGGDLLTMLYTVQLGAIEVHPWLSRLPDVDAADRCLIDLDPGEGVSFSSVIELARDVRAIARQCSVPVAVKTSGSRGIHLVIPLPPRTSYDESAQLALLIARAAVAHRPDLATVERSIRARPEGTIYVDSMQNSRGKSMACAYSVRAKEGATVSAPLREQELTSKLRPAAFTLRSIPARVARTGDLWEEALSERPSAKTIRNAMIALEQVLDSAPATKKPQRGTKRSRSGGNDERATAGRKRKQHA